LNENKIIEEYFEKTAEDFDSIYSQKKPLVRRVIDFVFRRSIEMRFALTLEECGNLEGKSLIDVGCGSGRYSIALAKRGARVIGIDFAENMLAIARNLAKENKVEGKCEFIKADFLNHEFSEKFDLCVSIGVLEYFQDPRQLLEKMAEVTKEKVLISLPVKWTLRSGIRKIRLALKRYPVYFYTKRKVELLLQSCGFSNYSIKRIDRDYFIVVNLYKEGKE